MIPEPDIFCSLLRRSDAHRLRYIIHDEIWEQVFVTCSQTIFEVLISSVTKPAGITGLYNRKLALPQKAESASFFDRSGSLLRWQHHPEGEDAVLWFKGAHYFRGWDQPAKRSILSADFQKILI